jgi:hypothetical protein
MPYPQSVVAEQATLGSQGSVSSPLAFCRGGVWGGSLPVDDKSLHRAFAFVAGKDKEIDAGGKIAFQSYD